MKKSIFRRILSIAASVSVLMTLGVGGLAPSAEEAETGYVLNPGFESWNDDGSATNWGLSTTWIKSTDDKKSGEAAVKIEQGAGGAMWNNLVVDDTFDLQAAATLSMWVKYENITGNGFQIGLERPAADKNDNILSDAYTGTSDGWVQLTLSVPASELEVTGWVIKVNFEAGEGTLLVDDVVLNAVAKEEGGDDGDEGEEGGDDGEEQPSADKQPGVVITGEDGVSLITNNGFENGDADWGVVGGASITTEETHSGAKAVKAVMGAEGYSMWSNLKNEVTLDKNEALTLSFWVKLDGVTGDGVSIGVERTCMSMDGKVSDASVYGEPLTGTSDWQKVTLAVPATKDCYSIVVKVNFGAGEGTAYIDDCYFSAADPTKVNLLNNGGFELVNNSSAPTEINAWALSTGWDQMPGAIVTGGDVHGGVRSVSMTLGGETRSLFQSNNWGVLSYDIKDAYVYTAWVKYSGVTGNGVTLKAERKAGDETITEAVSEAVTGTSDGWVQLRLVVPATTKEADELVVSVVAEAGEGTLLVDDAALRPAVQEDLENGGSESEGGNENVNTGVALPVGAAVLALVAGGVLLASSKRRSF